MKLEAVEAQEKTGLTPEKIKELVAQDKVDRIARAKSRIDTILETERCVLIPIMVLTSGQVVGRVEVQALD